MSVTFSVYHNQQFVAPEGWMPEYEEDPIYGKIQTNQNPLELNVANGNYCRLMELLGLSHEDYCGTWGDGSLQHVKTQIEFCMDATKAMPELDGGKATEVSVGANGATWVDCGLRAGYFGERLNRLKEIVDKAIEVGGVVTFG